MPIPPLPVQLRAQTRDFESPLASTLSSTPAQESNLPHFTSLYRFITAEVLDSDAGTKSISEKFGEEGVDDALERMWVGCARERILVRVMKEVVLLREEMGMGTEERELWIGVLGWLEMEMEGGGDEVVEELMREEIERFRALDWKGDGGRVLGNYIDGVEGVVRELAERLVAASSTTSSVMIDQDENDNDEKRRNRRGHLGSSIPIPSVASKTTTTTTSSSSNRRHNATTKPPPSSSLVQIHKATQTLQSRTLTSLLSSTSTLLSTLLSLHATLLTSQIHQLETFAFSTHSRHLTTRSSFLSTVSQGIALKAEIMTLLREKEIYAHEGMEHALRGAHEALKGEEAGLMEREAALRDLLARYDCEETMAELGREYKRVLEEGEDLKGDLEKLDEQRSTARRR